MIFKAEVCALLGYYIAESGNSLTMFQENLLVPSSRVKSQDVILLEFTDLEEEGGPRTSIRNYHSMQCYRAQISSTTWQKPEIVKI
jgi:hypothetical protein